MRGEDAWDMIEFEEGPYRIISVHGKCGSSGEHRVSTLGRALGQNAAMPKTVPALTFLRIAEPMSGQSWWRLPIISHKPLVAAALP